MISTERKEWFRSLLHPLVRLIHQLGITPNALTIIGFLFAVLAGVQIWKGSLRSGALLLLAGGVCDMLDGAVARLSGNGSKFGAFLDSTVDRYAEIVPFLCLAYHMRDDNLFLLPFIVITGSLLVSYTRARIEGLGGTCTIGFLERPERIVLFFLGLLLGGIFLDISLVSLAAGSHFTAFQRMRHARSVL